MFLPPINFFISIFFLSIFLHLLLLIFKIKTNVNKNNCFYVDYDIFKISLNFKNIFKILNFIFVQNPKIIAFIVYYLFNKINSKFSRLNYLIIKLLIKNLIQILNQFFFLIIYAIKNFPVILNKNFIYENFDFSIYYYFFICRITIINKTITTNPPEKLNEVLSLIKQTGQSFKNVPPNIRFAVAKIRGIPHKAVVLDTFKAKYVAGTVLTTKPNYKIRNSSTPVVTQRETRLGEYTLNDIKSKKFLDSNNDEKSTKISNLFNISNAKEQRSANCYLGSNMLIIKPLDQSEHEKLKGMELRYVCLSAHQRLLDNLEEKKCSIDIVNSVKIIDSVDLKEIEQSLTLDDIKLKKTHNSIINANKNIILDSKQFVLQKKDFSASDYVFKTDIANGLGPSEIYFDQRIELFTEKLAKIFYGSDLTETIELVKFSKSFFFQLNIDNYIYFNEILFLDDNNDAVSNDIDND
jgi:hypothetical protein